MNYDPPTGIDVTEPQGRELSQVLCTHFGDKFQQTQPMPLFALEPLEQDEFSAKLARAGFSVPVSARAENKRREEDAAIAADLAYQRLKDSGELPRRERDRAHALEVNERTTNNLGQWV